MAWFRKEKKPLKAQDKRDLPADVFDKCPGCSEILYRERLAQNLNVCPTCSHHLKIGADAYLSVLVDSDTFEEIDAHLRAADPLGFASAAAPSPAWRRSSRCATRAPPSVSAPTSRARTTAEPARSCATWSPRTC